MVETQYGRWNYLSGGFAAASIAIKRAARQGLAVRPLVARWSLVPAGKVLIRATELRGGGIGKHAPGAAPAAVGENGDELETRFGEVMRLEAANV
jgi:hypothetical protein